MKSFVWNRKCIVKAVKQAKTPGIRCAAPKGFYNCEGYIDHAELEFVREYKIFKKRHVKIFFDLKLNMALMYYLDGVHENL